MRARTYRRETINPAATENDTPRIAIPATRRLLWVNTHSSIPLADRSRMQPANVSTSKIHATGMPTPLCRFVMVAAKPLCVVVTLM